jgi:hypothetical protein
VRPVVAALALAAWTAFVWTTRIVNVALDDDLSVLGAVAELIVPVGMTALAAHLAWVALARRDRLAVVVGRLAAFTVIVWLVSVLSILLGGHGAAFVVVHTGLAVLSVALAVLAVESAAAVARDSGPAPAGR